ncbi:MAG: DUF4279 domain-containing protein, partial [Thermoleophilia bacterium]
RCGVVPSGPSGHFCCSFPPCYFRAALSLIGVSKFSRPPLIIPDKQYHRVARTGSWRLHGDLPEKTELEEQVRDLLSKVTNDLAIWNSLAKEFKIDIFCGVFLEDWNRGFDLSPQVLKMLSERGITIRFDIYSYGREEEE